MPKVRQAAPPPEAVAVQHSSSYLYRQRRQEVRTNVNHSMCQHQGAGSAAGMLVHRRAVLVQIGCIGWLTHNTASPPSIGGAAWRGP